ncbi:MAG: type II secretion system minor pseudopilin GspK [Deltaproteobacteria bacterium]|nr:type II secretion system minor pseudopilin GspK [Deltaproteobacteria bacterium]
MSARTRRRTSGVVLVLVLFYVLLLATTIATLQRRVAIDAGIAVNRDRAAAAEALARGGVRLAETLLLEDLRLDAGEPAPDSLWDVWARAGLEPVFVDDEGDQALRVEIEDAAARLDLNALAGAGGIGLGEAGAEEKDGAGRDQAPAPADTREDRPRPRSGLGGGASGIETRRLFLAGFLTRVIETLPERPAQAAYDPEQLAANLLDWVDEDEVRQDGGPEDEPYQQREPPYRAPNRPLLSLDELRLVEGFDGTLVEALRPYATVYPLAGGGGLNLNTAPSWVLAQLTRGSDVSGMRPVEEEDVRRVLDARDEGLVCSATGEGAACTPVLELFDGETISPPMLDRSSVFLVRATARVVDVERRIEAVIDRRDPQALLRLSWRVE